MIRIVKYKYNNNKKNYTLLSILGVREFLKWSKPQNTPKPPHRLEMKTGSYTEPCKCHTCVRTASYMWHTLSYLRRNFFFAGATVFLLARLFFAGATLFAGATFFSSAYL